MSQFENLGDTIQVTAITGSNRSREYVEILVTEKCGDCACIYVEITQARALGQAILDAAATLSPVSPEEK